MITAPGADETWLGQAPGDPVLRPVPQGHPASVAAVRIAHAGKLARWLGGSLLIIVPVFFVSTLLTFLLGAASGLNPAAGIAGDSATPQMIAAINAQFGLDRPLSSRYVAWISGILHGDLGLSWFSGVPVSALIGQRLVISLSVAGLALLIGILAGTALGLIAAAHQGRRMDRIITAATAIVSTLPPFVVAILLILTFSLWLGWLPASGYIPPSESVAGWLARIILPALALSVDVVAELARQLRTGLVEALSQNYVVGAVVRGLSRRRILFIHVLRNGAGPAVTMLAMKVPTLIGGAVVTETIFTMPGLGKLSADSALRGDVPVVQGALVVSILLVLAANILINMLLGVLQPAAKRRR